MEKIVVLDDDKNIVSLLEEVLEEEGYEVGTFLDSNDFIEYAKRNNIDLLIVDLRLPGMNGIEVVGELKKIQPDCKVIMITGYLSIQSTIGALRQGVSDYLIKPFNIDSIKKTIQKVLSSKKDKLSFPRYEEKEDMSFIPSRLYIDNRTSLYVIETNIDYLYKTGKIDNVTYNLLRTHVNRLKGTESGGGGDLT